MVGEKCKEIILKSKGDKVSFKSKNCKAGIEQLHLLMNGLMRVVLEVKLNNNLTDIETENYCKELLEDLKKGVSHIEEYYNFKLNGK